MIQFNVKTNLFGPPVVQCSFKYASGKLLPVTCPVDQVEAVKTRFIIQCLRDLVASMANQRRNNFRFTESPNSIKLLAIDRITTRLGMIYTINTLPELATYIRRDIMPLLLDLMPVTGSRFYQQYSEKYSDLSNYLLTCDQVAQSFHPKAVSVPVQASGGL